MSAKPISLEHIVIIGASAGGIDALSRLTASLPEDFPAPVLVAQHLDPRRPSQLVPILQRHTSLTVKPVEDHSELEPGVIYVIPSNTDVDFADSDIRVLSDGHSRPIPSIDRLLESAAGVFGERLIAVILTGSGSDGTSGAHRVKEMDGTVIIQDPRSAEYPDMPRSLAPTSVDFVRDVDRIGELLSQLVTDPEEVLTDVSEADAAMEEFLSHIRDTSSIDFGQYKTPTILRRLQRRLVATNTSSLAEYWSYLRQHEEEYNQLINSFLIKVTEFFRDKELFDYVQEQILPGLVEQAREQGNQLRIWSAGCATGEEAYSLAILVAEVLGQDAHQFTVRIFATDVDEHAISFGRRGVYSAAALKDVSGEIIEKYFNRVDGEYEISKQIRSMVVFGQHDLAQRSPFPSIDLIFCRNVLIYFTPELQRRALQLFAYSLRNRGYLILGKSESTSPFGDYFAAEEPRLRVYQRHGDPTPIPVGPVDTSVFAVPRTKTQSPWMSQPSTDVVRIHRDARHARSAAERSDSLLFHLPVGMVVVDSNYDIRTVNNRARQYLGIHGPAVGEDLLHLVRTMSLEPLRDGIVRAFRQDEPVNVEGEWRIETVIGDEVVLSIVCQRQESGSNEHTVVVLLTDITHTVSERNELQNQLEQERAANQDLESRVAQLHGTTRQLTESNRELAEANENLRMTNEQLMVTNEESQAAAEEIETLNEELQTTNEELETLNEELQATVEELNATNEDMRARTLELVKERGNSEAERARLEAILASMGDAVLAVGPRGDTVMMNDACRELFGEDLTGLVPERESGAKVPAGETPISLAQRGEAFNLQFIVAGQGGERRWFEASGRPIRQGLPAEGSVVVIREITDRSLRLLQEEFMSVASHELRTPLTALRGYLDMLQSSLPDDDERSQRRIAVALDMVNRLVRLVSDLLDVGRLQTGKFELELDRVDYSSLVREAAEMAQAMTSTHRIETELPDQPVHGTTDAMRVQQVLLNLLANAVTYSGQADRAIVRLSEDNGHVSIEVEDFGDGIPEESQHQLFTRFYQGDKTSSSSRRGLGLGLFIAREIVNAHGGTIDVNSTLSEGSTFTVRLPLHASGG